MALQVAALALVSGQAALQASHVPVMHRSPATQSLPALQDDLHTVELAQIRALAHEPVTAAGQVPAVVPLQVRVDNVALWYWPVPVRLLSVHEAAAHEVLDDAGMQPALPLQPPAVQVPALATHTECGSWPLGTSAQPPANPRTLHA